MMMLIMDLNRFPTNNWRTEDFMTQVTIFYIFYIKGEGRKNNSENPLGLSLFPLDLLEVKLLESYGQIKYKTLFRTNDDGVKK